MPQEFTDFLEKHQGALITAFFGLVAWLFLRWANSRRKELSVRAKLLLKRLQADTTHEVKGITLHRHGGMVNYWPFRVLDSDKVKLGMFYELDGEYLEVVQAVEELVTTDFLSVELETDAGLTVYRLQS